MEPQAEKKSHRKLLILIIASILLGAAGFAVYWFLLRQPATPLITLGNGKMYPAFTAGNADYTIYTTADSLSFSCSGEGAITGCDAPVPVAVGSSTHRITIGDHAYSFAITRLNASDTTLKIKSVRGTPTAWVPSADLAVTVENSGTIKELEYSFDGGKTWRSSNIATITKNGTYQVVARDYFGFLSDTKAIKITKVDSDYPIVSISKEQKNGAKTEDNQAILTAVVTDETSGVKSISWNTGATTEQITVHTGGTYTLTATDNAGNVTKKSINVTFSDSKESSSNLPDTSGGNNNNQSKSNEKPNPTPSPSPSPSPTPTPTPTPAPTPTPTPTPTTYTFAVQFIGNGATPSVSSDSCSTTGSSCTVRAASISRNGWEILGWAKNKNATTVDYSVGANIPLSGNLQLYAITRKPIAASFNLRDSNAANQSGGSTDCTLYNTASSCNITAPTLIAKSGYTVDGWTTNPSSTSAPHASGVTIPISSPTTFYSVTHRTASLAASFVISDSDAATQSGGVTSCLLYNGATECALKAPTLTAKTNYIVDGWHDPDHDQTLASGESFLVDIAASGHTYYAVTRSTISFSATFNLQDSAHLSKASTSTSCTPEGGSCTIAVPTLTATDSAYEAFGWSSNSSATTAENLSTSLTLTAENNGKNYYSVSRRKAPNTATFAFQDSAHLTMGSPASRSCYVYNGAANCSISTPTLSAANGYTVDGWTDIDGGVVSKAGADTTVLLRDNVAFYSVSHRTAPVTATFNIVDSSISHFPDGSTAAKTVNCYLYNSATSCQITAPGLSTNDGYAAVGWQNGTTTHAPGETFDISSDLSFSSVVNGSFTVTFRSADPSHLTFSGGATTTTQACDVTNASSCTVNFPTVTATDRDFLGWARGEVKTTVDHSASDHPSVSSSVTFYTVSKKDVSLSFALVDRTHFSLSSSSASCTFYNNASGCSIAAPTVSTTISGYTLLGWSTTQDATTYNWNGAAQNFSSNASYYSVTRYNTPLRVYYEVAAANKNKISTPPEYDQCYLYNGAETCAITLAVVTPTSASYSFGGWGVEEGIFNYYLPAGIRFSNGPGSYRVYAIVGSVQNLTFANNAAATGSGSGLSGNNLAANALSFNSGKCVTYNGTDCYVKEFPRIYAHGKDVYGFSTKKLSGFSTIIFPSATSPVAPGSTLYSRVWQDFSGNVFTWKRTYMIVFSGTSGSGSWSDVTPDTMPGSGAEYYPVEFDDSVDEGVAIAYGDYVSSVFNNIPGAEDFHGRMRFMPSTVYDSAGDEHDGSAGITLMNGQFAQVDLRLTPNSSGKVTDVEAYTKYAIVHELGHAIETLINDRAAFNFRATDEFKDLRKTCYNLRTSGTPCLSNYAYYNVTYDSTTDSFVPASGHSSDDADVDGNEFFAELFTAWYLEKFAPSGVSISTGNNSGINHNAEFATAANSFVTRVLQISAYDYNVAAYDMEGN